MAFFGGVCSAAVYMSPVPVPVRRCAPGSGPRSPRSVDQVVRPPALLGYPATAPGSEAVSQSRQRDAQEYPNDSFQIEGRIVHGWPLLLTFQECPDDL